MRQDLKKESRHALSCIVESGVADDVSQFQYQGEIDCDGVAFYTISVGDFGPSKAQLVFRIASTGNIELHAWPTIRDDHRLGQILSATSPVTNQDPIEQLTNCLSLIQQTVSLYRTSDPRNGYSSLVALWQNADYTVVLMDRA